MKRILLLALSLYLLLAPISYHPDNKLVLYYATLGNGKVWDIYSYLENHFDAAPKFHYPPMHYFAIKAEYPLVRLFGGEKIDKWLGLGSNIAFEDPNIFRFNFATKLPIILMVLVSGWLIYNIALSYGVSESKAKWAGVIWLFNPITIYSAVLMGQNDMLAILPFLAGWLMMSKYPFLAFWLFGIAGSIKTYPLIWAIMFGLAYKSNMLKKITLIGVSLLTYVLTLLPFLKYDYFKREVMYSGLATRMFEPRVDIGFGESVLLVPLLLTILAMSVVSRKKSWGLKSLSGYLVASNLVVLGFIHFHPQWMIWVMPFLAIYLAIKKKEYLTFWILNIVVCGVVLLFDDKFLYWGLWSPLNNGLLNLPLLSEVFVNKGVDVGLLNNLLHTMLAGTSIYWLWVSIKNDK
jgi:hypothetical protein